MKFKLVKAFKTLSVEKNPNQQKKKTPQKNTPSKKSHQLHNTKDFLCWKCDIPGTNSRLPIFKVHSVSSLTPGSLLTGGGNHGLAMQIPTGCLGSLFCLKYWDDFLPLDE